MARRRRATSAVLVPVAALRGDAAGNVAAAGVTDAGVFLADLLRVRRELRMMRHERTPRWSRWSLAIMAGWQFTDDEGRPVRFTGDGQVVPR